MASIVSLKDYYKWEEFFRNLNYKPNWDFDLQRFVEYSEARVIMTMRVPDSRKPVPQSEFNLMGQRQVIPLVPITKTVLLGPFHGEEYAKDYIRFHIRDMEDHEIDEWFRYKGELVFDPHKEPTEL